MAVVTIVKVLPTFVTHSPLFSNSAHPSPVAGLVTSEQEQVEMRSLRFFLQQSFFFKPELGPANTEPKACSYSCCLCSICTPFCQCWQMEQVHSGRHICRGLWSVGASIRNMVRIKVACCPSGYQ